MLIVELIIIPLLAFSLQGVTYKNKQKKNGFFFFFGGLGFALACLVSTSIQCHDGFVFLSLYYAFINLLALEFMTLHSCSIHISNTLLSYCIYMFKTLQKKYFCLLCVYWCIDNSIECLIITFFFFIVGGNELFFL